MSQRSFRFLHAADLHLDQPVEGLVEVPERLVDLLIDCPLRAAARVFDAAIDHQVDFVLLAGDAIDWNLGSPREALFLVDQFERLAERNIAVYWATGPAGGPDERWSHVWPRNVRVFPAGRVERQQHEIAGRAVCEIIGRSCSADPGAPGPQPYDFAPSNPGLISLAVTHAQWNCGALGEIDIHYWALGGRPQRATPLEGPCVAHCAGSPQGRSLTEVGPHGCTLVSVDAASRFHLTPLTCDIVRWHAPTLSVADTHDRAEIQQLLGERTRQLVEDSTGVVALVTCTVVCEDYSPGHRQFAAELLAGLRGDVEFRSDAVWIVDVRAVGPERLPDAWCDEDSIRGEFLRAVGAHWSDRTGEATDRPPPLVTPDDLPTDCLQSLGLPAFSLERPDQKRRILQEVARLGADLLSPEEPAS